MATERLEEMISISESVRLLKDAVDRANTPDGPRPFLFDTLSLRDAKRILGAWADAGLVDGCRGHMLPPPERRFECFFNFLGWWQWSLGIHVDVRHPHIDAHVPFGFFRIGWHRSPTFMHPRVFGYQGWQKGAAHND
jgi:hypothetical protein